MKAYYQACQDKKYAEAYKMLPTATQAYYGDAAGFQSTLEGYGVTGFIGEAAERGRRRDHRRRCSDRPGHGVPLHLEVRQG